jgi:hypothetical protein
VGLLFVSTQSIYVQESPAFEKIRDVSPDGKFALRISCTSEPADPDNIDLDLTTAAELVLLPSKNNVIKGRNYSGSVPDLIWSKGANWLECSLSSGSLVTDYVCLSQVGR